MLEAAQPDMAALANMSCATRAAALAGLDPGDILEGAARASDEFARTAARAAAGAAAHAAALIDEGATVLTHSRSSTVLRALLMARSDRRFRVIVTESRPMLEGRVLARSLAESGVEVTLIADAAAGASTGGVDLVLFGADRVTPSHLVNKIGTGMMALAARERAVRVYGVCDSSKFSSRPGAGAKNVGDPGELWDSPPAGVQVVSLYFEAVPLDHFTGIITEAGALSPEQARQLVQSKDATA